MPKKEDIVIPSEQNIPLMKNFIIAIAELNLELWRKMEKDSEHKKITADFIQEVKKSTKWHDYFSYILMQQLSITKEAADMLYRKDEKAYHKLYKEWKDKHKDIVPKMPSFMLDMFDGMMQRGFFLDDARKALKDYRLRTDK